MDTSPLLRWVHYHITLRVTALSDIDQDAKTVTFTLAVRMPLYDVQLEFPLSQDTGTAEISAQASADTAVSNMRINGTHVTGLPLHAPAADSHPLPQGADTYIYDVFVVTSHKSLDEASL